MGLASVVWWFTKVNARAVPIAKNNFMRLFLKYFILTNTTCCYEYNSHVFRFCYEWNNLGAGGQFFLAHRLPS